MQLRPHHWQRAIQLLLALALVGCGSVPKAPSSVTTPSAKPAPSAKASQARSIPVLPPAGSGRGGYYQDDGPGDEIPEGLFDIPDAEPQVEPYSTRGNRPYVVFGKRYIPITHERPLKQRGMGSWYGKKFHGQRTSSGELYDMYKMTAAHPTLPIPSYARVTNISNGKQVIVRVNDRGPFHSSRIIDLSYTAALKLGYIGHGSAELEVERLLPDEIARITANRQNPPPAVAEAAPAPVQAMSIVAPTADAAPLAAPVLSAELPRVSADMSAPSAGQSSATPASGFYLQFGAYSQAANAEVIRARVKREMGNVLPPLEVVSSDSVHRLFSGPFASRGEAAVAAQLAQESGLIKPFIVRR
jgi:rare lipoprotein A